MFITTADQAALHAVLSDEVQAQHEDPTEPNALREAEALLGACAMSFWVEHPARLATILREELRLHADANAERLEDGFLLEAWTPRITMAWDVLDQLGVRPPVGAQRPACAA